MSDLDLKRALIASHTHEEADPQSGFNQHGFTLVELLVAIAIFSVLSLTGWWVFDQTMKIRERNTLHEQRIIAIQHAYSQTNRDLIQVRRTLQWQDNQMNPALVLEATRLSFSKGGVLDPLQQGMPPDERIEYRYDANRQVLERSQWLNLRAEDPIIQTAVILENVSQVQFSALNPDSQPRWPLEQTEEQLDTLPKGIQLQITVNEIPYEFIWALPALERTHREIEVVQNRSNEQGGQQGNGQAQNGQTQNEQNNDVGQN